MELGTQIQMTLAVLIVGQRGCMGVAGVVILRCGQKGSSMKLKPRSKIDIMQLERDLDIKQAEVLRLRARVKELECKCSKQKQKRSLLESLYYELIEKVRKGLE